MMLEIPKITIETIHELKNQKSIDIVQFLISLYPKNISWDIREEILKVLFLQQEDSLTLDFLQRYVFTCPHLDCIALMFRICLYRKNRTGYSTL